MQIFGMELLILNDLICSYWSLCWKFSAPVIIFVEDFDLFAGVRGKFIHTKKQDHEAFINQLLVELDG
ncbi:putative inactive ATP-dependent zinc metalloprotease FTSHI 5, chloroplastic [Vitis vinifera]|uniref:Putative inactive ATP-dependent zinc metalloprotease FTSHI 5, chloroplastic n=1 Tax=Vitis vinifera TaxID=29760 RepID=A0A438IHP2_VITVI|nr:putative inactive ATP-dependent zinc metalloprotease FTSHI 5, chloroplastic [Vitis vinifera]RVW95989.1 putative inactive ATP-dependent zinc metalloprotease FTSHI 5, chloroplastic [Vitis vinifera]